jgi:sorting nexin-8
MFINPFSSISRSNSHTRNHPILKDDGLLAVFLTEPSFETWRKHTPVSLEEESTSKRVDRVEEMSIPSDLEEKLAYDAFLPNPRHSTE